jgi:hypothetical protein
MFVAMDVSGFKLEAITIKKNPLIAKIRNADEILAQKATKKSAVVEAGGSILSKPRTRSPAKKNTIARPLNSSTIFGFSGIAT